LKIYNFTGSTLTVSGQSIDDLVFEVPDSYRGDILIAGAPVTWSDEPFQYILATQDNGSVLLTHPIVKEPPYIAMLWLLVCAFSLTFFVKIIQKLKTA
tara:strand:+ start:124 stop:417 length:294 start_codon:yes stop_codon:yes gene_type:complete